MQVKIVSIGLIHKEVSMKQHIFRHHATNSGTIDNHNKIQ